MSFTLIAGMTSIGVVAGFFAGLLGFGGGVVMFPLLYYIPPLLDLARIDAKTVAAVAGNFVFVLLLICVLKIPRNSSLKKCALQAPRTQRFYYCFSQLP